MSKLKLSEENVKTIKEKLMKKDKLIIVLLIGLIIFVFFIPTEDKEDDLYEENETVNGINSDEENIISQEKYKTQLEEQLSDILQNAYGVGEVKVMITLASTSESIVKEDKSQNTSDVSEDDKSGGKRITKESESGSTTVYAQAESGQIPYVVKEKMPAVEGVLVIAKGDENSQVAQNISDAVKALFGIEAHKIKVMKMVE